MIALGIESTAHSFGIGIITDKGKVLANVVDMYKPKQGFGIEPMLAAKHHKEVQRTVYEKALSKAKIEFLSSFLEKKSSSLTNCLNNYLSKRCLASACEEKTESSPQKLSYICNGLQTKMLETQDKIEPLHIDLISFSRGPGLPPCLYVGLNFAKELEKELKKPLLGVNHCIAHIEIGKLFTKSKDPVTLYTSGANTQIIAYVAGRYRIFGETIDIGIGNALDKFGRAVGMQFPAGPKIEELAKKGKFIDLPYVVKGMDLSFSGIITECIKQYKAGKKLEDICFSLQETVFAMLTEVTERALAHTGKNEVLLTGGVAANTRLQEMLRIMCKERGAKFYLCPPAFAGDNGVNIAWAGILAQKSEQKSGVKNSMPQYMKCDTSFASKLQEIAPRERTDDVEINWLD